MEKILSGSDFERLISRFIRNLSNFEPQRYNIYYDEKIFNINVRCVVAYYRLLSKGRF